MSLFELQGGRIVAESQIGFGGQGTVFRGQDKQTGATVAIKRSNATGEIARRFQTECELLCDFSHRGHSLASHVVKGLEFFEEGTQHFLIMEYVEGHTLENHKKLAVRRSLRCLRSLLNGISFLHDIGCVHRDIKPANLIHPKAHDDRYFIKIVDLGMVKVLQGTRITQHGLGSYRYSAPECFSRHEDATFKADLYSAGAVLYYLVTGTAPGFDLCFRDIGRYNDDYKRWVNGDWSPTPLHEISTSVTIELSDLIARCLSADESQRPESATELLNSIRVIERPYEILKTHAKVIPNLRATIKKSVDTGKTNQDPVTLESQSKQMALEILHSLSFARTHLSGDFSNFLTPLNSMQRHPKSVQDKFLKLVGKLESQCHKFSQNSNGATAAKWEAFLRFVQQTMIELLKLEHKVDDLLVGIV